MLAFLVDAFTNKRFEGNRAGVVFDAGGLTRIEKQLLASEIGAPETAFVSSSNIADFKVEFFTPTTEVDFCGHATIATFYMLAQLERVEFVDGIVNLTQETKAGVLPVSISRNKDIVVSMRQRKPQFTTPTATASDIAGALNIGVHQLDARFPLRLSNTGNWHLMVAVTSKDLLDSITYDVARLSAILSQCGAITAHVFSSSDNNLYYARNFCPTIGIPEDPATGAAAGAFGAYLAQERILTEKISQLQIIQGEAMGRPSQITVIVQSQSGVVEDLQVSGTAIASFSFADVPIPMALQCR